MPPSTSASKGGRSSRKSDAPFATSAPSLNNCSSRNAAIMSGHINMIDRLNPAVELGKSPRSPFLRRPKHQRPEASPGICAKRDYKAASKQLVSRNVRMK